ncbi:PREDICTED: uncharacterized protein LOC109184745 [Ipomoea nil]|uniref:uncharacterized protein LOC109184745 n=1 Tax=Ipomoea nil TaxID=35883 RepID=UPI000900B359|nr:PREDICTED: uncharacterized protein LOC109184745 [Ipomoea nil]
MGDFNDIACQSEKLGEHPHPGALIEGFNDTLGDCQLVDLGMTGGRFTWEKGRGTDAWVEERLDRVVASLEWLEIYEEVEVRNVWTYNSDHYAIFLDLDTQPVRATRRAFKFESAWLLEEGCAKVVDEAWRRAMGMCFQQKIAECGQRLWRWGESITASFGIG